MVAEDHALLLHVPQGTVDLARVHPVEAQLVERLLQLVAVGVFIAQDEEEKRHEPVGRRLLQHFVSHPLAPSLNRSPGSSRYAPVGPTDVPIRNRFTPRRKLVFAHEVLTEPFPAQTHEINYRLAAELG